MRRTTPFLLALLLAAAAPAAAQEASVLVGARIRLIAPDLTRAWIVGRMVYADSATVIIDPEPARWGKPLALDQTSIMRVQLSRGRIGSQRNRYALIGGIAGVAVGAYAAWSVEKAEDTTGGGWILVPIFSFGGIGVGAAAGAVVPREGWDPVSLPVKVLYEPRGRSGR